MGKNEGWEPVVICSLLIVVAPVEVVYFKCDVHVGVVLLVEVTILVVDGVAVVVVLVCVVGVVDFVGVGSR